MQRKRTVKPHSERPTSRLRAAVEATRNAIAGVERELGMVPGSFLVGPLAAAGVRAAGVRMFWEPTSRRIEVGGEPLTDAERAEARRHHRRAQSRMAMLRRRARRLHDVADDINESVVSAGGTVPELLDLLDVLDRVHEDRGGDGWNIARTDLRSAMERAVAKVRAWSAQVRAREVREQAPTDRLARVEPEGYVLATTLVRRGKTGRSSPKSVRRTARALGVPFIQEKRRFRVHREKFESAYSAADRLGWQNIRSISATTVDARLGTEPRK